MGVISFCELPSTYCWIVVLSLFAAFPATQIALGILYRRQCEGDHQNLLVLWNLLSGVLLLSAILMELVYSCTMRLVVYKRQRVHDKGQPIKIKPRRVIFYPLMVIVYQVVLGISAALGLYIIFVHSCVPVLNSFTTVAVYMHLLGVLTLPPFCCVSYSWYRSDEDEIIQSESASQDNDGSSLPYTRVRYLGSNSLKRDEINPNFRHTYTGENDLRLHKTARAGVKPFGPHYRSQSMQMSRSSSLENNFDPGFNPNFNMPPFNPNQASTLHRPGAHSFVRGRYGISTPTYRKTAQLRSSNNSNVSHYENVDTGLAYKATKDILGTGIARGIEEHTASNPYISPVPAGGCSSMEYTLSNTFMPSPLSSVDNAPITNGLQSPTTSGVGSPIPFRSTTASEASPPLHDLPVQSSFEDSQIQENGSRAPSRCGMQHQAKNGDAVGANGTVRSNGLEGNVGTKFSIGSSDRQSDV